MRLLPALFAAIFAAFSLAIFAMPVNDATLAANDSPKTLSFENAPVLDVKDVPAIANYTIRARVDLQGAKIEGEAKITWKNTRKIPANDLCLHLYLNAFRDKDSLFYQGSGGESRGNEIELDQPGSIDAKTARIGEEVLPIIETNDGTTAQITLDKPVQPGEEITVTIPFVDTMPAIAARTGQIPGFLMGGQWFPKIAVFSDEGWVCEPYYAFSEFYSDFGNYDVTLEVPQNTTLGASGGMGEALEDTEDGFSVRRFQVGPVHDFSFALGENLSEISETVGHVKVRVLFPSGQNLSAENHLEAIRRSLPYFEAWLGIYPYDVLTVVEVPKGAEGAGGMEYPTLITTWGGQGFFSRFNRLPQLTTIHELAHQWFYGLVASNEVASPFLDEGLTSYVTAVAFEKLYENVIDPSLIGFSSRPSEAGRIQFLFSDAIDPIAQSADRFRDGSSYGTSSYAKTSAALATLQTLMPEGSFKKALGHYARQYRFLHPTPDSLFSSLSDSLQVDLRAFQKEVFENPGQLDYAISKVTNQSDVSVWVQRKGTVILPTEIILYEKDGSTKEVRWSEEEQRKETRLWKKFTFPESKEPSWVEVRALPLEAKIQDNARFFSEEGSPYFWSTLGRVFSVGGFSAELLILGSWL